MIGKRLAHYQITTKIGEGGMGEVYLAKDTRLPREVAIKILPAHSLSDPRVRARFRREAEALARLNHPNVATVHDFNEQNGIDFLVMEYVPGETLRERLGRGPLSEEETIRLGLQLCEGLQAAHVQGVVHRDLKPGNLKITEDGRLKILDFGLAKATRSTDESVTEATEPLTGTLGIAGTVPYMAPEQLRGQAVDERTDVHAAGAVLYEMATGQRRFAEHQGADLIDAILNKDADLATVPEPLREVTRRALQRDMRDRYGSAEALRQDLQRVAGGLSVSPSSRWRLPFIAVAVLALLGVVVFGPWPAKPPVENETPTATPIYESVAVIPLEALDLNDSESHVVLGLTEVLIKRIGMDVEGLRVPAWQTVRRYADSGLPPAELAKELNVEALIFGTIRSVEGRLRVGIELVDGRDGSLVWGEDFEQEQKGSFLDLERRIARRVAERVKGELSGADEQRLGRSLSRSVEAFDFYLKGTEALQETSAEANARALEYFDRAIALDAELTDAYIGRGAALWERRFNGWGEGDVKGAYERALQLDPDDPRAAFGYLKQLDAEESLSFAIEWIRGRPRTPQNLNVIAAAYWLNALSEVAIPLFEEILEQEPVNSGALYNLLLAQVWNGSWEDAEATGKSFTRIFGPHPDVLGYTATAYHARGNRPMAQVLYEKAMALGGTDANWDFFLELSSLLHQLGEHDQAREIARVQLRKMRQVLSTYPRHGSRVYMAPFLVLLGQDEAIENELAAVEQMVDPRLRIRGTEGVGITAMAYFAVGDPERGMQWLRRLTTGPRYRLRNVRDLYRLDMVLPDSIRATAEFQQIDSTWRFEHEEWATRWTEETWQ